MVRSVFTSLLGMDNEVYRSTRPLNSHNSRNRSLINEMPPGKELLARTNGCCQFPNLQNIRLLSIKRTTSAQKGTSKEGRKAVKKEEAE